MLILLLASADVGIVSCNRVAHCGATFHQMCLEIQNYDIHAQNGCLKCATTQHAKSLKKNEIDYSDDNDVIILD